MTTKFDLFLLALMLIPVLVDFLPSVQARLLTWSQRQKISPASISLGAGLIFVHNFSHPVLSYIALTLGFLIFSAGFAVAVACLKSRQQQPPSSDR